KPSAKEQDEEMGEAAETEDTARWIVHRGFDGSERRILHVSDLGIPGRHNTANALAAIAVAMAAGAEPARLEEPLRSFRGVGHRLEYVGKLGGMRYYISASATDPMAAAMSVLSLPSQLILIAGGLVRSSDYMDLLPILR